MNVSDLPGRLVPPQSEQEIWLKRHVARLCQLTHDHFPGSQPVSFGTKDLAKLETQDYWVCEKSDGIRVLFLVQTDLVTQDQSVYLIDRKNAYRQVTGFFFPHHENPMVPLRNTIIDGELVFDIDPHTKRKTMRYLAFDCLVVDEQNVMSRPLDKRYGRLNEWFYKPYAKMIRDHPHVVGTQPFDIKIKEVSFSYRVENVFAVDIPALQHGNDGLIYTCVNTPYTPATDPNILKWKPPSENSVDFKLVLRFPPSRLSPSEPDFFAKPVFALHVWCGDDKSGSKYESYDEMYVDDAEWENLKSTGEQVDDRIVEVHWDPAIGRWRMMRFRDDKPNGNHRSVVENIIQSIADGVEKETLLAGCTAIRNAWKARHAAPAARALPHPPPQPPVRNPSLPLVELRYGPLAPSRWSKVAGPAVFVGMQR